MNKKMVAIFLMLMFSSLVLSGCIVNTSLGTKIQEFHGGDAVVEIEFGMGDHPDTISIRIYEQGNYRIMVDDYNRTITVHFPPRELGIEVHSFGRCQEVTIIKDGVEQTERICI
jgi:predicted small secreted protein